VICDFNRDLEYSLGERQRVDCDMIQRAIPNCVSVEKTDTEQDKRGIDYVATLDGGATINIDAKARRKGAVKEGHEPRLALELWSVCPDSGNKGKPGWTCSRSTDVDMILYTFDRSEWDKFYLVPYQHLRMAFQRNYKTWAQKYPPRKQDNRTWKSEAMFVPASVVLSAITAQMTVIA
jgi:hypothetical protein